MVWFYHPQNQDSVIVSPAADTVAVQDIQYQGAATEPDDTSYYYFPDSQLIVLHRQAEAVSVIPRFLTGTPLTQEQTGTENYTGWNSGRNFFVENGLTGVVTEKGLTKAGQSSRFARSLVKPVSIRPEQRNLETYDWFLGLFLLLAILFIWIRVYYSKFFASLASALISFQISAKLFRGKNILIQRVSIVLDFIYIMVISLFILELTVEFGITGQGMNRFNLLLLFLNIVILYTLARIFILWLTGYLFMVQSLTAEYIHNTFMINKGMGIALFPVVIMAHYFPGKLVPVVLAIGGFIFLTAFIFKGIRGYQIIIRKDVLLFYLILYLCTLEILPLLLGYKVVISFI